MVAPNLLQKHPQMAADVREALLSLLEGPKTSAELFAAGIGAGQRDTILERLITCGAVVVVDRRAARVGMFAANVYGASPGAYTAETIDDVIALAWPSAVRLPEKLELAVAAAPPPVSPDTYERSLNLIAGVLEGFGSRLDRLIDLAGMAVTPPPPLPAVNIEALVKTFVAALDYRLQTVNAQVKALGERHNVTADALLSLSYDVKALAEEPHEAPPPPPPDPTPAIRELRSELQSIKSTIKELREAQRKLGDTQRETLKFLREEVMADTAAIGKLCLAISRQLHGEPPNGKSNLALLAITPTPESKP